MRNLRWLRVTVVGILVSVFGWAINDRIKMEEKVATMSATFNEIKKQLDRLETKMDRLLMERSE